MTRLVLGLQPVRELLRAQGARIRSITLQQGSPKVEGVQRFAESLGVAVRLVPRAELDRISRGEYHQGAAAEAPPLVLNPLETVLLPEQHGLLLALDGIQDPQNFGATIRSAVGLGRTAVLWAENASAPLTPTTFRASAGAIEHATLCRTPSLPAALEAAVNAGYQVIGLDGHAEQSLHELPLALPTVLVVGNEGDGLGKAVRRRCTAFGRVASPTTVDSLNASVAAALALYEACRQRGRL